MIVVNNRFDIGSMVCFRTGDTTEKWMVTGVMVNPNDTLQYRLTCGMDVVVAYEFEITEEGTEE